MRVLVTGAGGMLGQDVLAAASRAGYEALPLARSELDIRDGEAVAEAIAVAGADALINCAAWTDVDAAEDHREQAFAVNAHGAGLLARAAGEAGLPMLHVSSDYVFGGRPPAGGQGRAYRESDPTAPLSAYGESKLAGEEQVLAAGGEHTVVRSSWLFGLGEATSWPRCCAWPPSSTSGARRARCGWSPTRSALRPGPGTWRRP